MFKNLEQRLKQHNIFGQLVSMKWDSRKILNLVVQDQQHVLSIDVHPNMLLIKVL